MSLADGEQLEKEIKKVVDFSLGRCYIEKVAVAARN